MSDMQKIGLIGDYRSSVAAHRAIPMALDLAAASSQLNIKIDWIKTRSLSGDPHQRLADYHKIWCVPASPYENTKGVLSAIRYVRENSIPFLGTCGGYQHAILEFAHHVLGLNQADNAEVNPQTEFPLISPLSCSLVERQAQIELIPKTKIHRIYARKMIEETYHCSYGFNRQYLYLFNNSELIVSGYDMDSDPRSIELAEHRFFIATAFQPERSAFDNKAHPLISAFISA